jgi:hypothetical protein
MGFFSSPRRKNTAGIRLRKMQSKIKKLEKRAKLKSALKQAQSRLETLRSKA